MVGFKNSGIIDEDLADLFEKLDINCNGKIMYTEFLAATLENDGVELEEEQIQEAFNLISNKGTFITRKNLTDLLGAKRKDEKKDQDHLKGEIDEIFKIKSKIDYESFAALFEHGFHLQHHLSEITETSLNEEQLSRLKEDELIAHMSTLTESC